MASTLFLLVLSFSAQEHTVWFFVVFQLFTTKTRKQQYAMSKGEPLQTARMINKHRIAEQSV